ncbi:hypothetical protein [Lysinibacillus xylanilyticus]|nr:hypothetical protein [Lysinibacillus xylanilyticus]
MILLFGGVVGVYMVRQKRFQRFLGVVVLSVTALITYLTFSSAISFWTDSSVKDENDIELTSTLRYDRMVDIYEPHSVKPVSSKSYVYYLDNGTEIGLTRRQHKYSDISTFKIIYYNNPTPKEYDYKVGFYEPDTRGTPLIEADFVEIVE